MVSWVRRNDLRIPQALLMWDYHQIEGKKHLSDATKSENKQHAD